MLKRTNAPSHNKRAQDRPRKHPKRPSGNLGKSPKRAESSHGGPCPIMRTCGGCEWLGLPYRKQLARKHAAMVELFSPLIERFGWDVEVEPVLGMGELKIGISEKCAQKSDEKAHGFQISREMCAKVQECAEGAAGHIEQGAASRPPLVSPVTVADAPLTSPRGFRHKAASPFAPGPNGAVLGGFFTRGTHDIIACPACAVEAPGARDLLNEVALKAEALGIPAYDEDRCTGQLRYAIVRQGWRTGETMLVLVTRSREVPHLQELAEELRAAHPDLVCVAHNINPRKTNAILGGETRVLAGKPRMCDELLGCTFEISPVSFYQVNPQQTEVLYLQVIDAISMQNGLNILDAYCGSGTIGLCVAAAARSTGVNVNLIGVERNKEGVRDAMRNAERNYLGENTVFFARDATQYMLEAAAKGNRVDALIMDPPRAGSTPEFIEATASLAPPTVVYISCNPATQARDLELFAQHGYRLTRLVPVDLFPHTSHVETVATLTRE